MTQRYNQSFRDEAIRFALTGDKAIAQTAKDLGIKEPTLYNWVSQAKEGKLTVVKRKCQSKPRRNYWRVNPLKERKCPLAGGAGDIKKSRGVFREGGTKVMRYAFVRDESKKHAVELLCALMEVSRSGYYDWKTRPESQCSQDQDVDLVVSCKIFKNVWDYYAIRLSI
jgi:putative transposase